MTSQQPPSLRDVLHQNVDRTQRDLRLAGQVLRGLWRLLLLCGYPWLVFTHTHIGPAMLSLPLVLWGLFLLSLAAAVPPEPVGVAMPLFFLIAVLAHRVGAALRARNGRPGHSQFVGFPLLFRLHPALRRPSTAVLLQPLALAGLGVGLVRAGIAYGYVLAGGAVGLFLLHANVQLREKAMRRKQNDQQVLAEAMAETLDRQRRAAQAPPAVVTSPRLGGPPVPPADLDQLHPDLRRKLDRPRRTNSADPI